MHHDNPFAEEVRLHPHDDTPRLIFADFLEDSGNPQGEFIRIQVTLNQLPLADPSRTELERRERELIEQYGELWLQPLRELGAQGVSVSCFRRGLIERIRISARNFLEHATAACLSSPALHIVQITDLDQAFDDFAVALLPEHIRSLDLTASHLTKLDRASRRWFDMQCIEQLSELNVQFTKSTDDDLIGLCNRDLSRLQKLQLGANAITAVGARALAFCPSLHNLQSLSMPLNEIGDNGAQALAGSGYFGNLVELDLASNAISDAGGQAFADSITLTALERLNLRTNYITSPALLTFAAYSNLKNLRVLDVRNNRPAGRS